MVAIYDVLRRSRILGIFSICGRAAPFALYLLWAYFVLGRGLWQELISTTSGGEHKYLIWVWLMIGGSAWCGIASAVMRSIKAGMSLEQLEEVKHLN